MTRLVRTLASGAAILALLAPLAAAQGVEATPRYGSVALSSGFSPDEVVSVQSGGDLDASTLSTTCSGSMGDAPDVRLTYTAGSSPLIISAASSADTTLLISGPDGAWYCDDDSGEEGSNPSIRFGRPQSGAYSIWVGASSAGQSADLTISETTSR